MNALPAGTPTSWHEPRWYVLSVRSHQENRVTKHLTGRGVEHYLPCYSSLRNWKDRRVTLQMPLFPGYVFVRLALLERMKVLTVPQVVSLVKVGSGPAEMSAQEIDSIRRGVEYAKAEPHEYLKEGRQVEIISGVMAGMQGVLVRWKNCTRVVVCLDSIARAFVLEVDAACVKPLAASVWPS